MSEYDKREARWEAAVDRLSKMADFAALRRAAMGAVTSPQFGPGGSENIAPFYRLAEAMERVSKNPGAMKDLNDRGLYWGEKQGSLMRYGTTMTAPTHLRPLNATGHDVVAALNDIEGNEQKRIDAHIRQTVQIGRGINAQSEREQEANKAPANNREQDR